MKELTQIVIDATGSIESPYFHLNIYGGSPVYRERVYCYEFYHQMRLNWPTGSPFYLNGEIDKSAHPILEQLGASYAKPDFLVHQPGYMSGNHAIIEVKSSRAARTGIEKDLRTLSLFVSAVGYERAIYLVYGNEVNDALIRKIEQIAAQLPISNPIELWFHQQAGAPAEIVSILR
jgi:hypothetical protein